MEKQKIALFHPWIKSRGGAERVVLDFLKNTKNKVDVYTWIYDKENTFEEFKDYKVEIVGNKLSKKLSKKHFLRGLIPFISKSEIPLKRYNKFLISTSGVGEFITFKNYLLGKTYAYVHTPLREASENIIKWNMRNRYGLIKKIIYKTLVKIYNILEKNAWKKIDYVIFNSELSKKRALKKGLLKNKKNEVIYPPIKILKKNKKTSDKKYFLYVSRINPPKRQDVLIKAWNQVRENFPEYKLILIGNKENKGYLKKIKENLNDTIEIRSNISDEELDKLYRNCSAGIFLGYEEDFGIVPFEIASYGKPLLAPNIGGYFDLIKQNPLFIKIEEKHNNKEMIKEVSEKLDYFLKNKYKYKKSKIKNNKKTQINYSDSKDFTNKIERILG